MHTYQVFEGNDHSNDKVEVARKSWGREDTACYVISINGRMNTIQFAGEEPYPGTDLANSAELHIVALEAQERAQAE